MFFDKRKIYNFDPYNALLAIATNIPVWLMTGFVVQGHICYTKIKHSLIVLVVFMVNLDVNCLI